VNCRLPVRARCDATNADRLDRASDRARRRSAKTVSRLGRMIDFQRLEDLDEAFARVVWMVMAHEAVD